MSARCVAWFSPLRPRHRHRELARGPSGDASGLDIDRYEQLNAHDFVWRHRLSPYDLVVYQLGNSGWHDYMWAYLFHYPGLVVLHDARLHHARAAQLFGARRLDDYRREFAYDHPLADAAAAEYATEGYAAPGFTSGPWCAPSSAQHAWSPSTTSSSRELGERILRPRRTGHLGVWRSRPRLAPASSPQPAAHPAEHRLHRIRPGHGRKRIERSSRAQNVRFGSTDPHLLLVGANEFASLDNLIELRLVDRVHVTGYGLVPDYLAAAGVGLSLRWPTAQGVGILGAVLAAAKPTIVTSCPHLQTSVA
jgi:hypothetical protein